MAVCNPRVRSHTSPYQNLSRILTEVSETERERFSTSLIAPLLASGYGPELIVTLEQYLKDNLNVSQAAKHLYLHRNTLLYRLAKIHSLTGRNPRSFEQALELKLALLLYSQRQEQTDAVSWREKGHVG